MVVREEPIKGVMELKNYIDGEWVESEASETRDVVNPATLKTIAKVPVGHREDVKAAVDAAKTSGELLPDLPDTFDQLVRRKRKRVELLRSLT